MRICIDLDGVICELRKEGESYYDVKPKTGAIEHMKRLKQENHTLIIHTARHMKTCESNLGKVVAKQGLITLEWLQRHDIPFDEIYFGKPWADIYIDDNGFRFEAWSEFNISNFKKGSGE